jgi:portal protein
MSNTPRRNRYAPPAETAPSLETVEGLSKIIYRAAPKTLQAQVAALSELLQNSRIFKAEKDAAPSSVGDEWGEKQPPFDFLAAARFKIHNVHHSACIRAKTKALVGLGHVLAEDLEPGPDPEFTPEGVPKSKPKRTQKNPSKVSETLDPLCRQSWRHTLEQLAEDYWQVGNAYLEVVRESPGGKITGLHWQPASEVRVVVEDNFGANIHYVIRGRIGGDVRMATYGDSIGFMGRPQMGGSQILASTDSRVVTPGKVSEMIHIAEPTTLDRWYGVPQWLASSALVELVQALHQHQFDFHVNRGVPEFLMLLLGAKIDKKTWSAITSTFDGYVGLGNQHKASVFNITDPNVKVEMHKMAMEGIQNGTFFRDMSETLSTTIVSAHGVPPSLAGILIPGKMGATNESTNAIMVFQTLEIGPEQDHFESMLGSRLGDPVKNGGLGLERSDFELRTIIEEMAEAMEKLKPADTMARMKPQLPEAAAEGRDLKAGVKKSTLDLAEALERASRGLDG